MNLNPMQLNGPGWGGNWSEPGDPNVGFYHIGWLQKTSGAFTCPLDGSVLQIVGGGLYPFRCPQCGAQFQETGIVGGKIFLSNVQQDPPLNIGPADPLAGNRNQGAQLP